MRDKVRANDDDVDAWARQAFKDFAERRRIEEPIKGERMIMARSVLFMMTDIDASIRQPRDAILIDLLGNYNLFKLQLVLCSSCETFKGSHIVKNEKTCKRTIFRVL